MLWGLFLTDAEFVSSIQPTTDFVGENIDVLEEDIYALSPYLLRILLQDKSTGHFIRWGCDNYKKYGDEYTAEKEIFPRLIIGRNTTIIQPRIAKSKSEQKNRTRESAEVFTPSWICNEMNNACDEEYFGRTNVFNVIQEKDWMPVTEPIKFKENKNLTEWQKYVDSRRLEITCGEAPYLVSRYDTTTGEFLPLEQRIGLLDRKLRIVHENTTTKSEWFTWAKRAFESIYGYEFQGDNLLLARENLLLTFVDYFKFKFNKTPELSQLKIIANVIAWNVWQMDGLTDTAPYSVKEQSPAIDLFAKKEIVQEKNKDRQGRKNPIVDLSEVSPVLCQIRNWRSGRNFYFKDLKGEKTMKFDVVIGNPPYQGVNHQQIYTFFYTEGQKIANCLELIFPTGWQKPKNANSLSQLNNSEVKTDCQIKFINNKHNVFAGVTGAEWTNIILWERGYDNELGGKQQIFYEGANPEIVQLCWEQSQVEKPKELIELFEYVKKKEKNFISLTQKTSVSKPYGLRKNVFDNLERYNLSPMQLEKIKEDDVKIYGSNGNVRYVPKEYKFPRKTSAFDRYKVLVGSAWGNWDEKKYLGGAYADIIIAKPNEACTETYQESGSFLKYDEAFKHAKFLLTKFARALLYLNKFSQQTTQSWDAVPYLTYSEEWWSESIESIDNHLFEKYNIPIEVKNFVEQKIQQKKEASILYQG